jgi:uncharacterized protein
MDRAGFSEETDEVVRSVPEPALTPRLPWYAGPRAFVRALLQLDDTPHSIALGAAIGMWIGITPTPSIQMVLVLVTAAVTAPFFTFNRTAGLVMVYVTNPLTMIPIHWGCYKVGTLFVAGNMSYDRVRQLFAPENSQGFWHSAGLVAVEIGWPLLVGTLLVGTVLALLTYPAVLWLVRKYQERPTGLGGTP